MTHQTPMDYLNRQRIEEACYQLTTTDDSITEIAYRNGFNDLSYFIRTFKNTKALLPENINEDNTKDQSSVSTVLIFFISFCFYSVYY